MQTEDKRFWKHSGFDLTSALGSVYQGIRFQKWRGASTLSMQLATLLFPPTRAERHTFLQKLRQIRHARELERSYTKQQILEAYLNLVSFRSELQGVSAASEVLFGKNARVLSRTESNLLVALLAQPSAPWKKVSRRSCLLFPNSCSEVLQLTEFLQLNPRFQKHAGVFRESAEPGFHFAHALFRTEANSQIRAVHSTLKKSVQEFVENSLAENLLALGQKNVHDGAALVLENATGNVLAYVGNVRTLNSSTFEVDNVLARRQPGSTLKPFLYAAAFQKGILTPESLLADTPLNIETERGIYRPRNYDKNFQGWVSARVALASSLNIPAVRVLQFIGAPAFVNVLETLGFEKLRDAQFYGDALALGGAEVSLWELTNAYRTLANEGRGSPVVFTKKTYAQKWKSLSSALSAQVFSEDAAHDISRILSDGASRALTFGFDNALATPFFSAVKTGTSTDMRDNWCLGYSQNYTVGVWVGNSNGSAMWDVSGVSGAAPVWHEIIMSLEQGAQHPKTQNTSLAVRASEKEPQTDHFADPIVQITSPAEGTFFSIDPDIPPASQKVFFQASQTSEPLEWVLNGRTLGKASGVYLWEPQRGKYHLVLQTSQGHVVDSRSFWVR